MSTGPITSALPTSSYQPSTAVPLSRDGVTIAVIDATLDPSKIPKTGVISGTVRDVARDGTVRIDTDAGPLTARLPDRVATTPGEQVRVELPAQDQRTNTPATTIQRAQISSVSPSETQTAPDLSPKDLYTPAARPVSSSPAADINTIAQTSSGIKLSSGETIQAKPLSLPDAIKLLTQSTSSPMTTATLPQVISNATTVLLPHELLNSFMVITGGNIKNLFSMPPSLLLANHAGVGAGIAGLLPSGAEAGSVTSSKNFVFPTISNFFVSSGSLPATNVSPTGPTPPAILSMTIGDIRSSLAPTFTTSGAPTALPSPVFQGALSSSSLTQSFIVMGQTPTNETIIATGMNEINPPLSTFIIPTNTKSGSWPAGTIFSAHILSMQQPTPSSQITGLPLSIDPHLFGFFDDLDNINLQGPGRPITRLPIPNLSTPPNFGTVLFMFLAALRSGSINDMFGDLTTTAIKQKGRGDRIDRLSDMGRSLNSSSDHTNASWRSFQIPVQTDTGIMPVTLHLKHHHDQTDDLGHPEKQNSKKSGERVVMDVVFDRMGSVQMDMHLPHQSKRLDTILRTEIPLSRAMQSTITRLYAGAVSKTHMTGEIIFQGDHSAWVTVAPPQFADVKITA